MKPENKPDKETQTLQQFQREKIKFIEYLYDWLESGKSFEEIEIMIDIPAAAGRIPEYSHKICREVLDLIKEAQSAGLNRTKVLAYLREREKADTTYE
jgi:hypothetical protein